MLALRQPLVWAILITVLPAQHPARTAPHAHRVGQHVHTQPSRPHTRNQHQQPLPKKKVDAGGAKVSEHTTSVRRAPIRSHAQGPVNATVPTATYLGAPLLGMQGALELGLAPLEAEAREQVDGGRQDRPHLRGDDGQHLDGEPLEQWELTEHQP